MSMGGGSEMVPSDDYTWRGQVTTLVNGMPIEVDPRDIVGSEILAQGMWEAETAIFLLSWLRPGMTFVDAGAHVGQYSMLASGRVGAAGRVVAFEPHPVLGRVLRRNVRRAGCTNVTVSSLALGQASSRAELVLHPSANYGGSSLRPDGATAHHRRAPVRVIPLDEYLARASVARRVDALKLDVEGAELDVIEGASRTLAANPRIVLVVEFLRDNPLRFGKTVEDLEARLRELGFLLFSLTPDGLRRYEPVGERSVNVVAARQLVTLLDGLPEAMAASLLLGLARTRR